MAKESLGKVYRMLETVIEKVTGLGGGEYRPPYYYAYNSTASKEFYFNGKGTLYLYGNSTLDNLKIDDVSVGLLCFKQVYNNHVYIIPFKKNISFSGKNNSEASLNMTIIYD